jgi:hypothetical protein
MIELCRLIGCGLIGLFRSRASLEIEILALRHQLNILRRRSPKKPTLRNIDRLVFVGLYGLAPGVLSALAIVRPETVIRWHRPGFDGLGGGNRDLKVVGQRRSWKIRQLIREMSTANPFCGARELLKLGIDVGQTTVAKYMARGATFVPRMEDVTPQPC